jgi:2,4-diaminopentanoate dehydrogenase
VASGGQHPQWRVVIDGSPSLVCDLSTVAREGFGEAIADLNAARTVNLIASIVAAEPGCRSVRDFGTPAGTA